MFKKIYPYLLTICSLSVIVSCSEDSNPEFDVKTFTRIYDNNKFDASFFPIEMRQTPDGGYIVLGGRKLEDSNFTGIYLMKADKFGNFEKEIEVEETSVNPVAHFTEYQTRYYFFCMDPLTQQAKIASVDANLEAVTINPVQGGLTYPAASSFADNSNFVLLGYDNGSKQSVISILNTDGGILSSKGYSIGTGEDIEDPIIKHYIRTGRQFPFEVGKAPSGLYFFNGFFNYTFSLVFTNLTSDDPIGVVQGQQEDGGFSAVTPIGGNKFAAARFNYGDNFLIPNKELSTSGNTSSTDLGGFSLPELVPNATVRILRATVGTKNVLIYGSDTKTKQIGLLFYDESIGEFIGSKYLGFSNPFEIASITQTSDGGLAVCGTTYMAGRFPRICIFKISKDDLADIVNK